MRRRRTSHQPHVKNVRIVLLGKDGVGKSALTVRLLTRRFIGEYSQTLEDTYRHHIEVDNEFLAVELMDTAGENTDEKLELCVSCGDFYILLYSITDRESFREAERLGHFMKDHKNIESMSILLCGTKRDLEHLRAVEEEEGTDLANALNCSFYEISVSEGYIEVLAMFQNSLKKFLKQRSQDKEKPYNGTGMNGRISSLSKMKDGLSMRAFRRKSVSF